MIASGTRLGPYVIAAPIGSGGMGEVYRATDTNLGRQVAIKVLPDAFANDPERLARFEREAKTLAALNHPNIASIYGLEKTDGIRALVMELVEGPTLADRIGQGPIPIDEALVIAKQIAEALEAAHEQGIIHRDLKPANIKLRPDGTVKVLDFGLAKALDLTAVASPSVSQSPTITTPAMTMAGVILGTAAYMAPEQAKGRAADKRADIWAFGCVLYEMLSGRQAFQGEAVTEVLASVLAREADFGCLPANLHPKVADLLRRCLEKDLKKRWQAVGDLRVEIETVLADPRGVEIKAAPQATPRPRWKVAALVLASALIGAAIAGAAMWGFRPSLPSAKVTRFPFALPEGQTFTRPGRQIVAISPDGSNVVYVADNQLYLRRMAETEARPIPGTDQDVNSPFFSPDGQWVGFYSFQDSTLKKIAITGGAAVTLCAATNPFGVSWDGDTIIFSQGSGGILAVPATGGKPELWIKSSTGEVADSPQILPGGRAVLFTVTTEVANDRWDKANIVVQSREGGERKVLIQGGSAARYVPTGHIVYAVGTNLLAVPFDVQRLEVTTGPIPVVEGIVRAANPIATTAAANFGVSTDGTLAYIAGRIVLAPRVLALADRNGKNVALSLQPGAYDYPRFSPDGKQIAVQTNDDNGSALWIYDLSGRSSLRRLTFEGPVFGFGWSRDGRRVVFGSNLEGKPGIFSLAADGTGVVERLTTGAAGEDIHTPTSWSPDGNVLLFEALKNGDSGLWTVSAKGERKPEPLFDVPGSTQMSAEISPDGHWFAYVSDETKVEQIYIQPFPPTGAKYQISREHSHAPMWSPDGKELFYYSVDLRKFVSVAIQTQPSLSFGNPVPLSIENILQVAVTDRRYDVAADGRRFLMVLPDTSRDRESRATQQINIVLNWFEELKRLVPSN